MKSVSTIYEQSWNYLTGVYTYNGTPWFGPTFKLDLLSINESTKQYNRRQEQDKLYMAQCHKKAIHELGEIIANFLNFRYEPGSTLVINSKYLLGSSQAHHDGIWMIKNDITFWAEYVDINYVKFKNLGWLITGPQIIDRMSDAWCHNLESDTYLTLEEYKEDTDEL